MKALTGGEFPASPSCYVGLWLNIESISLTDRYSVIIPLLSLQNAIVSFKELCGLSAVANLKQCILALSPRLTGTDNSPLLVFNLADQYPNLEPQGLLPEVLKKVVTTYETVSLICGSTLQAGSGKYLYET